MYKIVTMVQPEDIYGNIGNECHTSGTYIFDANMLKSLPLITTHLNKICVNDNGHDIEKNLTRILRVMRFMQTYEKK